MSVSCEPQDCLGRLAGHGIEQAEVYLSGARSLSVEYAGGAYKSKEFSSDSGYGVRVLHEGRLGLSHSNMDSAYGRTVESAKRLSCVSPKTSFSFEPAHKTYPEANTSDPGLSGLEPSLAFSVVEEILSGISSHAEPSRISVSFSEGTEAVVNTSGLHAEASCTSVSIYAEAKRGRGMGFSMYSSRFLPDDYRSMGEEAGRIASIMSESAHIRSQEMEVKFSPHLLSSLLDFLMFHFDGDNKRRGISMLAGGEKRFPEHLSIIEDPLADGDSSGPFDGEGAPSAPKFLVKDGVVSGFLHDRYTAALGGTKGAGNCQRPDYASVPSPGISNLSIPAPKNGWGAEPERYLEVLSFHGLHTSDAVSGDFGVEADIAFLHEGEKVSPVTDALLTGNIFNLFNSISCLGKAASTHGNLISPEIWFSRVQVVGK